MDKLKDKELEQVSGGRVEHHYPKRTTVQCPCGAFFETHLSGIGAEEKIQLCPKCRGVYTGKHREPDPNGRQSRFEERFRGKK